MYVHFTNNTPSTIRKHTNIYIYTHTQTLDRIRIQFVEKVFWPSEPINLSLLLHWICTYIRAGWLVCRLEQENRTAHGFNRRITWQNNCSAGGARGRFLIAPRRVRVKIETFVGSFLVCLAGVIVMFVVLLSHTLPPQFVSFYFQIHHHMKYNDRTRKIAAHHMFSVAER